MLRITTPLRKVIKPKVYGSTERIAGWQPQHAYLVDAPLLAAGGAGENVPWRPRPHFAVGAPGWRRAGHEQGSSRGTRDHLAMRRGDCHVFRRRP